MLLTSIFTTVFLSALTSVNAQVIFRPAIGLATGRSPQIDDSLKINLTRPCGQNLTREIISNSVPVYAVENVYNFTATNFVTGAKGETQVNHTAIDTAGMGYAFNNYSMIFFRNGEFQPNTTGSIIINAKLPDNTTCTGGLDGQTCLVSLRNNATYGNCILVSQAKAPEFSVSDPASIASTSEKVDNGTATFTVTVTASATLAMRDVVDARATAV